MTTKTKTSELRVSSWWNATSGRVCLVLLTLHSSLFTLHTFAANTTNTPSLAGLTNPPPPASIVRITSNTVITPSGASNLYHSMTNAGVTFGDSTNGLASINYVDMATQSLFNTSFTAVTNWVIGQSYVTATQLSNYTDTLTISSMFQQTTNDFQSVLSGYGLLAATNIWTAPQYIRQMVMTSTFEYLTVTNWGDLNVQVDQTGFADPTNIIYKVGGVGFMTCLTNGQPLGFFNANTGTLTETAQVYNISTDSTAELDVNIWLGTQTHNVKVFQGLQDITVTNLAYIVLNGGKQTVAFLGTASQLNSIFGLDSNPMSSIAASNAFDVAGSAASVQSNVNSQGYLTAASNVLSGVQVTGAAFTTTNSGVVTVSLPWSNISGGIVYPLSVALGGATAIPVPGVNLAVGADSVGSNGVIYLAGGRAMIGYKGNQGAVLQAGPAKTIDLIVDSSTFGTGYFAVSIATNGFVRVGAKSSPSQTNAFEVVGSNMRAPAYVYGDGTTQTTAATLPAYVWRTTSYVVTNGTTNLLVALNSAAISMRISWGFACNANISKVYLWPRINGDAGGNYWYQSVFAGDGSLSLLSGFAQTRMSWVSASGVNAAGTNRISRGWFEFERGNFPSTNTSFNYWQTHNDDGQTYCSTTWGTQGWLHPTNSIMSNINFILIGPVTNLTTGFVDLKELAP